MRREDQIIQAKRIFTMIDQGKTSMAHALYRNPIDDYISENQAQREWELLFLERPLVLGASAQLDGPGAFMTHEIGRAHV